MSTSQKKVKSQKNDSLKSGGDPKKDNKTSKSKQSLTKRDDDEALSAENEDMVEEEDDEPDYEVEEIIEKKIKKGSVYYLVKWRGFSLDDCTWEPEENLEHAPLISSAFENKLLEKAKNVSETKDKSARAGPEKIETKDVSKASKESTNINNMSLLNPAEPESVLGKRSRDKFEDKKKNKPNIDSGSTKKRDCFMKMGSKPQINRESINERCLLTIKDIQSEFDCKSTKESALLTNLASVIPFLTLKDIAVLLTLNKKLLYKLHENPSALIFIIQKYYFNQSNPHPKKRKFFKYFMKKMIIEALKCSKEAFQIIMLTKRRIDMTTNLVKYPGLPKSWEKIYHKDCVRGPEWGQIYTEAGNIIPDEQNKWIITKRGGDGWKCCKVKDLLPQFSNYIFATSYEVCEMACSVSFQKFPEDFQQSFRSNSAVIKAGCFMGKRVDCPGHGGCNLTITGKDGRTILKKEQAKKNNELPTRLEDFTQIVIVVQYDEIKDYIDDGLLLTLRIYGRDEKWWAGNYGAQFYGMYIRGDSNF